MLIVDAHNLAFADDEARKMLTGGDPDGARGRVLELLENYAAATGEPATAVFDGSGGRAPTADAARRVHCVFSGAGATADAEILRLVRSSSGRRETRVVTSDRRLAAAVKSLHAKVVPVSDFLKDAAKAARKRQAGRAPEPRAKRTGAPPSDVEYWLRFFKDEDVADAERESDPGPRKPKR